MAKQELTLARLREVVKYDPETGVFTQNARRKGGLRPGDELGCLSDHGYVLISVDYRKYRAHRLAWFWMNGEWPSRSIDHINGLRTDNKWSNLRLASQVQNNGNAKLSRANTTGFKGVSKSRGKWRASITRGYKAAHLGVFDDPDAAHQAYLSAAKEYFGEFARAA